jgi:hypothetical protein
MPGTDPGARGQSPGLQSPAPRSWGSLPGKVGVGVVVAAAALGAFVTAVTGSEPGTTLGAFVIVGTAVAVLAVRPRSAYLIIPAPALAYVAAAAAAGLIEIHDRATGASLATVAVSALQWFAGGFLAMSAATALAMAVAARRWLRSRRRPPGPGYPGPGAAAGGPHITGAARRLPGQPTRACRGLCQTPSGRPG